MGVAKAADRMMVLDAKSTLEEAKSIRQKAEQTVERQPGAALFLKRSGVKIGVEALDNSYLVTLSPLHSAEEENRANAIFKRDFPGAFSVSRWHTDTSRTPQPAALAEKEEAEKEVAKKAAKQPTEAAEKRTKQIAEQKLLKQLVKGLDNEWLALIVLALLGLLLVMRSTRQIKKIKQLQDALEETQKRNSHYLNSMGKQYE